MINIGNNIRYLRTQHGYSQEDLAEKMGYKSYTTITKWESGVSEPTLKKANEIAAFFNLSVNDLCYKDLAAMNTIPATPSHGVIINILGRVAAGIPIEAIENIIDTEEITEELARTGKFFGLRIQGDSMEPDIHNGDTVIVRQQNDAENDEIVIALVNGNDGVCKRLKKYDNSIALVSLNAKYEPLYFNQEEIMYKPVRIIGKVVELRRKF
ncbi:MAG: helix-turn-helix domain-containing protein [Lachnospiraceae bacterium]|nr:helix-turn-helix domain-containing protein [Lachnospiraceae bacterium]MCM1235493.1 helix-turn-helix domain-containing protein [Ruminococcus flavefaciens]